MYKLTIGDLRLIDESTRPWQMTIDPILQQMEELPEEVEKGIEDLIEGYKAGLKDYYAKAMDEDGGRLADPIFREFDEKWVSEHPEYYDIDRLFAKATDSDKKRAHEAILAAKEVFAGGAS